MAKSLFEMDAAAFQGLIILALHDETNPIIPHASIFSHAESQSSVVIKQEDDMWVIFRVQAVLLSLMRESNSVSTVLHARVLKPVLLCLLYELFKCIL